MTYVLERTTTSPWPSSSSFCKSEIFFRCHRNKETGINRLDAKLIALCTCAILEDAALLELILAYGVASRATHYFVLLDTFDGRDEKNTKIVDCTDEGDKAGGMGHRVMGR